MVLLAGGGFQEKQVSLEDDASLFFYTDGLAEAENETGEEFGMTSDVWDTKPIVPLTPSPQAAMVEANRLDVQEAPQREIDHQRKQEEDKRAAGQKVRPENKANFRP